MEAENVFTEKYRPRTLDEVVGQEKITARLKGFVKTQRCPHMMFSGQAGIGKTTASLAFFREFFGEGYDRYFLELNASDEGGVKYIRGKVKEFTEIKATGVPFKFVWLDESDYLTAESQAILRRIIEKSSTACRFVLSCNYPNKIIEPIQDRCAQFRFKALAQKDIMIMLKKIVEGETIDITSSALSTLASLSDGSMRKPLNVLETIKDSGMSKVQEQDIYELTYWINYDEIKRLLENVKQIDLKAAEERLKYLIFEKCYIEEEILKALEKMIPESELFDKNFKLVALEELAITDFHISQRANPYLAIRGYIAKLMRILEG